MRLVGLGAAAVLAGRLCWGQDFCDVQKRRASTESSAALDRISGAVGFDPGTILLYASSDSRVRAKGGAMSLVCVAGNGEERWIVYDPSLVQGDTARDFVLAHETAHHINYQPQLAGQWSKQQELDADRFGSQYLTRLGWTKDKLLQALGSLGLPEASADGYPTLDERRAAVVRGFEEETGRLGKGSGGRGAEPGDPPPAPVGDIRMNPVDGLTYVYIPPGKFMMGCSPEDNECNDNEKPPKSVTIARGFWLGRTEVTQASWIKVMGGNPSHFSGGQLPVEGVNWSEAVAYCQKIGGRLPSEEEWEYAGRAGATGPRYGPPDAIAWYDGNSVAMTHPVGLKQANAFGLYDMLGNLWEWTSSDAPGGKIIRGGSFHNPPVAARSSYRFTLSPDSRGYDVGFRCVAESR